MVLSVAIIGKSSMLYIKLSNRAADYEVRMFIDGSLDIIQEKMSGANRTQELYIGPLLNDLRHVSYGYVTNTNIKMIIVASLGNSSLKDQDIRQIFKQLHNAYCMAISDPFYVPGAQINSKFTFLSKL